MYTLVDLFSGAGGLSLGFCLTKRFRFIAGIDNNEWALKTLYANHPEAVSAFSTPQDIQLLSGSNLLSALEVDNIDVVIGGPPCQGFSVAGRRNVADERNQMVWEYYRLIMELQPKIFVMENVPGLLLAVHKDGNKLTEVLQKEFEKIGYKCVLWKLNASDYGVPQVRKRTFLVGFRGAKEVAMPRPFTNSVRDLFSDNLPPVTVLDALSDLPEPVLSEPQTYNGGPYTEYQCYLRQGSAVLHNHTPSVHKPDMIERLRAQLPGTRLYPNWNHSWYKLDNNRPSPTVKENHRAPFVHPTEPRVTTPRECARLQSFPDRYVFKGTKTAQLMQIGNAVPPLLAKAIAVEVLKALDGK